MTILTVISKLNFRTTGIISSTLILFSILFGFILVPKLVRSQLRNVSVCNLNFREKKKFFSLPHAKHKLISFFAIIVCLFFVVVAFFIFISLSIFYVCAIQNLTLKPKSELRELWAKAPFAVTFKVYVFNITNPMDVMLGAKVCIK